MRARIRTVKPDILHDEKLWALGVETGMPIYQGFQGLWCYADREGRFEWRPQALKSLILPYWSGDYERVLDALASAGMVLKYTVDGRDYGLVINLGKHQAFNAREPPSTLPAPPSTCTHVHARGEWNGNGNGMDLSSDARERDGGPEPGAEPEPAPSSGTRDGERWKSFPKGWHSWSLDTTAAAVALGLTTDDLVGHVKYWTLRDFTGGPVNDLDGELRRGLDGIAERKRKGTGPPQASPAPDLYAWAPTAEHRAFAKERGRKLQVAVDAYRAARMPEKSASTLRTHEDFMRRLRWWADHGGEFPATGSLPRPRENSSEAARKAVGA